jgi:hypothetical protein
MRNGQHIKHRAKYFCCCVCILCGGNVFAEPLPSNGRLFWLPRCILLGETQTQISRWSTEPPFNFQNKKNGLERDTCVRGGVFPYEGSVAVLVLFSVYGNKFAQEFLRKPIKINTSCFQNEIKFNESNPLVRPKTSVSTSLHVFN